MEDDIPILVKGMGGGEGGLVTHKYLWGREGERRRAGTHVKKKVEAAGKFCASNDGIDVGLLTRPGNAAMIPELSVTIRKECYRAEQTNGRKNGGQREKRGSEKRNTSQ